MQLLLLSSEEGEQSGLGLIQGNVKKLISNNNFKTPNMGWRTNKIKFEHKILKNIKETMQFYFVHSYYCEIKDESKIVATSEHFINFPSIISEDKIIGIQFHPEKSNIIGMNLLKNFAEI